MAALEPAAPTRAATWCLTPAAGSAGSGCAPALAWHAAKCKPMPLLQVWQPAHLHPLLKRTAQGLHVEDNELAGGLPPAPCLAGLRELLLDWQAALDSAAALRSAIALSRLVLSGHRAVDPVGERRLAIRPTAAAEPLLATLAALPALRRVEDVFVGREDVVTAPVAAVMWQLGARCPHLALGLLQDGNVGMGLADLEEGEAAAGTATTARTACAATPDR